MFCLCGPLSVTDCWSTDGLMKCVNTKYAVKSVIHPPAHYRVLKLVCSYLTSVLRHRVVHLPAIHRKLLLVQEGKQGLPEEVTEQFSHDQNSKGFFFLQGFFFFFCMSLWLTSCCSSHFGHGVQNVWRACRTT